MIFPLKPPAPPLFESTNLNFPIPLLTAQVVLMVLVHV